MGAAGGSPLRPHRPHRRGSLRRRRCAAQDAGRSSARRSCSGSPGRPSSARPAGPTSMPPAPRRSAASSAPTPARSSRAPVEAARHDDRSGWSGEIEGRRPGPDRRGRSHRTRARPLADQARGWASGSSTRPPSRGRPPGPSPSTPGRWNSYRQAGIADAVVEGGVKVAGVNLWGRGVKAARLPFRHIGEGLSPFPYLLDFPQDAQRAVADRTAGRAGDEGRAPDGTGPFRSAPRRRPGDAQGGPDGSEEVCEAAYLAGCDGAHSTVRAGLGIGLPGGTYAGPLLRRRRGGARPPSIDHETHVDLDDGDFLAIFPMNGGGPRPPHRHRAAGAGPRPDTT